MYSSEIEELLEGNGIETGDRIEISREGEGVTKEKFAGILMPRPDVGDNSIIVIKLDNGYNIGVRFGKGTSIKKTKERKTMPEAHGAAGKQDESLPKVAIISTGGTIINKIDYETGGVYPLTKPEELLRDIPELAGIANVHVENLMSVASEDLTPKEWVRIAKSTADALNSGCRGVVIMHGTDTMHYTSAALSFMLGEVTGPVVLTGAQRSSDRGSSDAFMNLTCAVRIAAESDIGEVGICMHADSSDDKCTFIRGTKARKMHTSRRDAFRAINDKPIAEVRRDGAIKYTGRYRKARRSGKVKAETGFEQKVALLKVYPGSDPGIVGFYAKNGYKGMILEGTGLGHTPIAWIDTLRAAIESGIVIGMTSQTIYGRVNDKVYSTLRRLAQAGVVYCEDMTPETAYVKLGFLLGSRKKGEAAELLGKDMAGEITSRSDTETRYME